MTERDFDRLRHIERLDERRHRAPGARWEARPRRDEDTRHLGERQGHGTWGVERGYNQGGYGGLGIYERGYRLGSYERLAELSEPRAREPGRGPGRAPRGYVRSDERIREDVCERLMDGPADVSDVEVTVSDSEVTLSGTVLERWEKRAVEDIAAAVRGVQDVHNRLRIRRPAQEQRPSQDELAVQAEPLGT